VLKKLLIFFLITFIFFTAGCESTPDPQANARGFAPVAAGKALPVSSFREVWGYLVAGRELALTPALPITDLAYFSAEVNTYGKLVGVPEIGKLAAFRGRKHLVASCNGQALTYFTLKEGNAERQALIRDLLAAAKPYDGLQINFENVPREAGAYYLSFLRELRAGLGGKMLTVAIAARIRTLQNDVYDYAKITPLVDRVLVMAYDEHWSTSAPGPIASMGWSQRVARYSLDVIGREKLIMGLPFYGRSWGHVNLNRAYVYSTVQEVMQANSITEIQREQGIPKFAYKMPLNVTVYFEDEHSLATRLDMYRTMGVRAVGFWRLGQETPAVWTYIALENANRN
jgi:spore germination protein YaaH